MGNIKKNCVVCTLSANNISINFLIKFLLFMWGFLFSRCNFNLIEMNGWISRFQMKKKFPPIYRWLFHKCKLIPREPWTGFISRWQQKKLHATNIKIIYDVRSGKKTPTISNHYKFSERGKKIVYIFTFNVPSMESIVFYVWVSTHESSFVSYPCFRSKQNLSETQHCHVLGIWTFPSGHATHLYLVWVLLERFHFFII
jgi:hypothetical protein